MGLIKDIGYGSVCLDTAVFIYFIEENPDYFKIIHPLFEAIDKGICQAFTSGITLLETLVIPLRSNDWELADRYEYLLLESKGLTMIEINPQVLRQAASLRAKWEIKTPDALQIAAAQAAQCPFFITNDRRLPKIPNLKILQLSDYI